MVDRDADTESGRAFGELERLFGLSEQRGPLESERESQQVARIRSSLKLICNAIWRNTKNLPVVEVFNIAISLERELFNEELHALKK